MRHQDGYCDRCGCEVDVVQLTVDGLAVCEACVAGHATPALATARRPEARDDGR